MSEISRWQAVQQRDETYDNEFVYAVKTTGIYCRPTCPSRRPKRENVTFFETCREAENAGYRPCKRCHPNSKPHEDPQLDFIVQVCRCIEAAEQIPTLDELGERFAMSPFHLQRTFKRVVGVTPRQYADAHRQGRIKALLKERENVAEALYAAGYSTSSQLYRQADDVFGMTPTTYQEGGKTMTLGYAIAPCDLGYVLVAATEKGISKVSLGDTEADLLDDLHQEFPEADFVQDDDTLGTWTEAIVCYIAGEQTTLNLPLDIRATAFQRKVWETLRKIPYGSTRSYNEVAEMIGQPTAARAVARACATNPAALVVPCHRVVRKNGDLSGYRWGLNRKEALLNMEKDKA